MTAEADKKDPGRVVVRFSVPADDEVVLAWLDAQGPRNRSGPLRQVIHYFVAKHGYASPMSVLGRMVADGDVDVDVVAQPEPPAPSAPRAREPQAQDVPEPEPTSVDDDHDDDDGAATGDDGGYVPPGDDIFASLRR